MLRGQRTRERVLSLSLRIATEEGLDALTIGRVAEVAGITKVHTLFKWASDGSLSWPITGSVA
jgi:hypothetical protein